MNENWMVIILIGVCSEPCVCDGFRIKLKNLQNYYVENVNNFAFDYLFASHMIQTERYIYNNYYVHHLRSEHFRILNIYFSTSCETNEVLESGALLRKLGQIKGLCVCVGVCAPPTYSKQELSLNRNFRRSIYWPTKLVYAKTT